MGFSYPVFYLLAGTPGCTAKKQNKSSPGIDEHMFCAL